MAKTRLSGHQLIATSELDQARDEVAGQFCPHRLQLTHRDGRLDMLHNAAAIGDDVTLNYLRYGDEVRITPGAFESFFLAQIPLAGTARVKVGDRSVVSDRAHASLGSPTEPVDMVWGKGCEQLLVYIRRSAIEETAGADLAGPLVFNPLMDLGSPGMRAWMRLVSLALDDLESGASLFRSSLAATAFEQTLIAGLLAAQPNNSCVFEPEPAAGSRAVRAVVQLIETEPSRAWRVAELADSVGISTRTLQQAFQRELGMSPLQRLSLARLDRARRDLVEADPHRSSVTEIAARWGFFHLGRFSQTYRDTYRETPSQTLAAG